MIKRKVESSLVATGFCDFLGRCNGLNKIGFEKWVFYPGMLFDSLDTWWGEGGNRAKRHEGIDICFFKDKSGRNYRLDHSALISVIHNGQVIKIDDDYIGQSVFVSHDIYDSNGSQLHSIYGHTKPYSKINIGSTVRAGDLIAAIADVKNKKAKMLPHVHFSIAWIPQQLPYEKLNWKTLGNPQIVTLVNPLDMIICRYTTMKFNASINLATMWQKFTRG